MNYSSNCVVYGGTHDNETLVGYFKNMNDWDLKYVREYVEGWDMPIESMIDKIIRLAYRSVASVAIFQLQDILKLGNEARINLPSTVGENWKWRMEPEQFIDERTDFLAYLTDIYGR
jgi:4-alpha-glucanotransferase